MKLIQKFLIVAFITFTTVLNAQDKIEFKNSTPKETVESHFAFLRGKNYNPKIASFTLGKNKFSEHQNEMLAIKLKEILELYQLNVSKVLNRKKGIVEKDKYMLFNKHPKIYLIRKQREWIYSPETVNSITEIYNTDILHQKEGDLNTNSDEILHLIQKDTSDVVGFNLSTPYDAVLTHLIYTTDSLFDPVKAAKTIHFLKSDSAKAETMAIKLSQIFLGSSKRLIDFDDLSKDSNYIDSVSQKHIFYPYPAIPEFYLEKIGDDWLYSVETSQLINAAHDKLFSDGAEEIFKFSDKFKKWSGHDYKKNIFGVEKWQLLMLLYALAILFGIWIVNIVVIKRLIAKVSFLDYYKESTYFFIKNIAFLIYFKAIKTYVPSLELTVDNSVVIHKILGIMIILSITLLSLNILNLIVLYTTRDATINSKRGVVIFSSLMAKIVIFVACVLFVINELEYSLVNVLAGLSIGGFAIALGAQDTVKNFFGSLMIFADKPFSVGDFITDGKMMGTVEEVGIRTTKIRTAYGSVVTLPNSMLSDNSVDNWGKREYRRYKSKITIEYGIPNELVQKFIEALKEDLLKQAHTRKDYYVITVNDFSLYGIEILINIFFIAPTWGEEMEARHTFIMNALAIAEDLGIKYAKPLR